MARLCFEVKRIEFNITGEKELIVTKSYYKSYLRRTFYSYARMDIPKISSRAEVYFNRNKMIVEFNKPISLNTVNNFLVSLNYLSHITVKEIEYKVNEEKVIIKVM